MQHLESGALSGVQREKLPYVWGIVKILMEYDTIDSELVEAYETVLERRYGEGPRTPWNGRFN